MDAAHMGADLERVLISEEEIQAKLAELADEIATEYAGQDLLLTRWHGQGPVHAPGDLRVARSGGRVHIDPAARV